jgi:CDP-glucose 4,6-dehydratase
MNEKFFPLMSQLQGPILITGHTGFKGTWLSLLLKQLGARVIGLSLAPEAGSLYSKIGYRLTEADAYTDIRDLQALKSFIEPLRPSAIFHFAAQPLVLESYLKPRETFEVNVMGTMNLLQVAVECNSVKAVLIATTDKVYKNDGLAKAFNEDSELQGHDPYSSSKVAVEIAADIWRNVIDGNLGPKIVTMRAGNVIGGGDQSKDRLIPDIVRSIVSGKNLELRNPSSTRPWQHVLDPLYGYIQYLEHLLSDGSYTKTLNFGPTDSALSVSEVIDVYYKAANVAQNYIVGERLSSLEAKFLELDSSRAKEVLGWAPLWSQHESVARTANWWGKVIDNSDAALTASNCDIMEFLENVGGKNLSKSRGV